MSHQLIELAKAVQGLAETEQHAQGQLLVLTCSVAALVRSHPDPAAFASEFRRFWQLLGQQHSNDACAGQTLDGIEAMLEILEEACKVPLGVRPGR